VRLSELVNNLKSVSSRLIRKEFADVVNQFYSKPVGSIGDSGRWNGEEQTARMLTDKQKLSSDAQP
jgi:REP element-mobilizing transposase RayT